MELGVDDAQKVRHESIIFFIHLTKKGKNTPIMEVEREQLVAKFSTAEKSVRVLGVGNDPKSGKTANKNPKDLSLTTSRERLTVSCMVDLMFNI